MGDIHQHAPVLLITSAFSRYPEALDWAKAASELLWGPVGLVSDLFDFVETTYYEPTMGPHLKKVFFAYERLISPEELPAVKRQANAWEAEYAALGRHAEPRPLNLDPGYLTLGKVILASTKDHSHRLYLTDGIYGEVTLKYRDRAWLQTDWTFPDYRRPDYHQYFEACRNYLRGRQRAELEQRRAEGSGLAPDELAAANLPANFTDADLEDDDLEASNLEEGGFGDLDFEQREDTSA